MRIVIKADKAPKAVGPYSQAIKFNNLIFASGQISINPETGKIEKGTVADQTRRALNNLNEVLKEAGASLDNVLKCNVYLSDIKNFDEMNRVYQSFFTKDQPARLTVAIADIFDGLAVEIDAIAGIDESIFSRQILE